MKEITIEGVVYVPTSALKKKFKYSADYIGQLCRARKIDARLVGRSWYVNPLSLENHKQNKFKLKENTNYDFPNISSNIKISRQDETSKIIHHSLIRSEIASTTAKNYKSHFRWTPIIYDKDDVDLLPTIKKTGEKVDKMDSELVNSEKIPIKISEEIFQPEVEKLPTVLLRGKLTIDSLDETFKIEENGKNNFSKSDLNDIKTINKDYPETVSLNNPNNSSVEISRISKSRTISSNVSLIPRKRDQITTTNSSTIKTEKISSRFETVFYLSVGVFIVSSIFLFFGEVVSIVEVDFYNSTLKFSTDYFAAFLSYVGL